VATSHSRFKHEDRVSLECFAALSASPASPDVTSWWAHELKLAPSRAARAGVVVAAIEAGVSESELVSNVKRRRARLSCFSRLHAKTLKRGQTHGS
jgi:hypothetical protein